MLNAFVSSFLRIESILTIFLLGGLGVSLFAFGFSSTLSATLDPKVVFAGEGNAAGLYANDVMTVYLWAPLWE